MLEWDVVVDDFSTLLNNNESSFWDKVRYYPFILVSISDDDVQYRSVCTNLPIAKLEYAFQPINQSVLTFWQILSLYDVLRPVVDEFTTSEHFPIIDKRLRQFIFWNSKCYHKSSDISLSYCTQEFLFGLILYDKIRRPTSVSYISRYTVISVSFLPQNGQYLRYSSDLFTPSSHAPI